VSASAHVFALAVLRNPETGIDMERMLVFEGQYLRFCGRPEVEIVRN